MEHNTNGNTATTANPIVIPSRASMLNHKKVNRFVVLIHYQNISCNLWESTITIDQDITEIQETGKVIEPNERCMF